MRAMATGLALALALVLPSRASAQQRACAEGRVRGAASQGRCCWPGQVWSSGAARCDGPPVCPSGFVEEGDGCIRGSTTAPVVSAPVVSAPVYTPPAPASSTPPDGYAGVLPDGSIRYGVLPERGAVVFAAPPRVMVAPRPVVTAVPVVATPYAPPAPSAPPAPLTLPVAARPIAPPPRPVVTEPPPVEEPPPVRREPYLGGPVPEGAHVEARVNLGLVITGPLLFVVGYFYGFACMSPPQAGLVAVPFVGPILTLNAARTSADQQYLSREIPRAELLTRYDSNNTALAVFAIPSLIVQATGASLLIAGAVVRRHELVYAPATSRARERPWAERVAVVPAQTSTFSGLSLVGSF